jgi:hypothetical protein
MRRNNTIITIGIIYLALYGLCWIFLFSEFYGCQFLEGTHGWFEGHLYSDFAPTMLIGIVALVPIAILYMLFTISDEASPFTTARVGFYLGIPGWALLIFSLIVSIMQLPQLLDCDNHGAYCISCRIILSPVIFLIAIIGLIGVGTILFVLTYSEVPKSDIASPSIPPSAPTPPQAAPNIQLPPSPTTPLPPCPKCGSGMRFVPEYHRYYCAECNRYS